MKESFERIKEWVKEHPWLTVAILLGVGVLAYFAYKNGWIGSLGGDGSSVSTVPDSSTVTTDSGAVGGGSSPADSGSGGFGSFTAPPAISPMPVPTYTGSEQGAAGGNMGAITPTDNLSNLFGGAPVTVLPGAAGTGPIDLSGHSAGAAVQSPSMSNLAGVQPVSAPSLANVKGNAGGLTPSQQAGKGKRFTGTYQGITYENGYPVGLSAILNPGVTATQAPFAQAPASQVTNVNTAQVASLQGAVGNVGVSTPVISRNTATAPSLQNATGNAGGAQKVLHGH